jgi:hypothetical protein
VDASGVPCRYHPTTVFHAHISPGGWTVGSFVAAVQKHILPHRHHHHTIKIIELRGVAIRISASYAGVHWLDSWSGDAVVTKYSLIG